MKKLIFAVAMLAYIAINNCFSQVSYSHCTIYTVFSPNEDFYLRTTPYDNIVETLTGETIVCGKDGLVIYKCPLHFELYNYRNKREVFLSNDGRTIAYVMDMDYSYDGIQYSAVQLYRNGEPFRTYALSQLVNCDPETEECHLRYNDVLIDKNKPGVYKENATDLEKRVTEQSVYLHNDTLFIFAKGGNLLTIDLNSGDLASRPFTDTDKDIVGLSKPVRIEKETFEAGPSFGLPKLADGRTVVESLAGYLDMAVLEEGEEAKKYKRYSVSLEIILDKQGNANVEKIEDNYQKLPEEEISAFFNSHTFDISLIPAETKKWRFKGYAALRNKDKNIAMEERAQEIIDERIAYEKRLVADSINGVYIPVNIEDCFLELNKILKKKDVDYIKNMENRNSTALLHFSLGMWLRNNWGLGIGSRLQKYLKDRGATEPDGMSSLILKFYYDWLNGRHEEWKKYDAKQ